MEVKDFRKTWTKLKKNLSEDDIKLFEEVVDIDGTCGRRITGSIKPYNPRYVDYWFAVGRCHWNVILPCWLLNDRKVNGKYAIITSEKHSAIINTEDNTIFDPTYVVTGSSANETLERLTSFEISNIVPHVARVDMDMFYRFTDFLPSDQRKEADKILKEVVEKLQGKL